MNKITLRCLLLSSILTMGATAAFGANDAATAPLKGIPYSAPLSIGFANPSQNTKGNVLDVSPIKG